MNRIISILVAFLVTLITTSCTTYMVEEGNHLPAGRRTTSCIQPHVGGGGIVLGATVPYMRVQVLPQQGRQCVPQGYSNGNPYPSQYGYNGVGGFNPYDANVDPRRYGMPPGSQARSLPGDASWSGFQRNHPSLFGRPPRQVGPQSFY